jgi:hypothetical protein
MGRPVDQNVMAENIRKGTLELTENFKFAELQTTGPTVPLTQYVPNYDPNYFLTVGDQNLDVKKVNSFYMYLDSTSPPSVSNQNQTNAGYNLKFRTIDVIEVLINVAGTPIYWTRHNGQVWLGDCPSQAYYIYMRYQKEHPFPNAGVPFNPVLPLAPWAGTDTLYIPNSWQDIFEYQSAMRLAQELNLSSKASELQIRLYGDQKFQKTGGLEGSPGLIFQRTSQENRDQTTSQKSFRLRMPSV